MIYKLRLNIKKMAVNFNGSFRTSAKRDIAGKIRKVAIPPNFMLAAIYCEWRVDTIVIIESKPDFVGACAVNDNLPFCAAA